MARCAASGWRVLPLLLCLARALQLPPAGRGFRAGAVRSSVAAEVGALNAEQFHRRLLRDAEEDTPMGHALARGLGVLRDAFRLYGADRVVASFNGGKDAVVILHLSLAALAAHNEAVGGDTRLRVIFFEIDDEFPEIDSFVRETVARHHLDLVACAGVGFAEGLGKCIAQHGSAAFVLGTRQSDPKAAGQQDFAPSSDWMPPFMRVNPILTWSYHDVWAFLRAYELSYCTLYDEGYTSLGKVSSTQRNPALRRMDGSYAPAWQLVDASLERAGRDSSATKPAAAPAAADPPVVVEQADPQETGETGDGEWVRARNAALLIVGDEILGGKQQDGNTLVAAQRLRAAGVALRRVCVVADDLDEIVSELRRLTASFDVVLTSGGLGPTHDDITLKGVARALGVSMARSTAMAETIVRRYEAAGKPLAPAVLEKMSTLPSGARMRTCASDPEAWPILQCANIFVLPGVPALFTAKLETIASDILNKGCARPPLSRLVRLAAVEESIVDSLNTCVAAHPAVDFGSYPVSQGDVLTIITLEVAGGGEEQLEAALASLVDAMPDGAVVEVSDSACLSEGAE